MCRHVTNEEILNQAAADGMVTITPDDPSNPQSPQVVRLTEAGKQEARRILRGMRRELVLSN